MIHQDSPHQLHAKNIKVKTSLNNVGLFVKLMTKANQLPPL